MIRGIVITVLEGLIKRFTASGRAGETFANREYMQHYGYTSRPLAGAEIIIINEGNHYIAIASDDRRYRLSINNGEVALYTDEGDKVHLKRGRKIVITGGEEVSINTKAAKVNASVSCDVTSPAVTINGSATCTINSPEATINASASCTVNSPSIVLGAGATNKIVDQRVMGYFNLHTHPYGGVPDQQLNTANCCTSVTKAL